MSFNENDFYPSGAQGSSSSSSEPATPWLRKDELAEALEDIKEPPANATQKTIRQRLAGLIGRLKSISPAVVLSFTFFILHSTFADTIPWEEVPPDTPVDTNALLPVAETDPVFTANSNRFLTAHQSLAPATNYTDSSLIPYLKIADSASAFTAPRAYTYFRDLYDVADTNTLVIFADGTHDTTGDATLSFSFVGRRGGPVAIYGGTNLTKLDAHLGGSGGASGYNGCLASIICPEVTSIGYMSFYTCYRLAQVELPKCVYVGTGGGNNGDFAVFCNAAFEEIDLPAASNICSYAFAGNGYLKRAHIPTATSIGTHAFESCESLELVDFGDSMRSVPSLVSANAFADTPDDLAFVVPDALYDTWIASGNWATIAASKRFYKHSEWTKVRGDGVPPPDLSGYATSAGVTNIVRDLSLGGIWDEQMQVWWTPRMRNGSLTYEATTNVNLNAED